AGSRSDWPGGRDARGRRATRTKGRAGRGRLALTRRGNSAAAMEPEGEQLAARPALETEGLRFLHVTVGSLLATYGWYILFICILLYVVFQKLSTRLRALRQRQLDQAAAAVEPDVVVKRQEALAAARLKMQEELNAQVEKHKEKLKQLEEEKRRQKIEMWDSMQEGKSYRGNTRRPQVTMGCDLTIAPGLLLQSSPKENLTESLCGEVVTILCLVKEGEPAPGDLDAEARQLVDEAKN
ncbi:Selenoprotein S, partial [Galemys pyrenaicus]